MTHDNSSKFRAFKWLTTKQLQERKEANQISMMRWAGGSGWKKIRLSQKKKETVWENFCVCVCGFACLHLYKGLVGPGGDVSNSCRHTKGCAFCHPGEGCMPKLVCDADKRQAWQHRRHMVSLCVWLLHARDRFLHLITFCPQAAAPLLFQLRGQHYNLGCALIYTL